MNSSLVVLVVFAIMGGAVLANPDHPKQTATSLRAKRAYEQWLDIISQYARKGGNNENHFQPFPVDLPVVGKDGRQSTLPLLVLPFPVPAPGGKQVTECSANINANIHKKTSNEQNAGNRYNANYDVRSDTSDFQIRVDDDDEPQYEPKVSSDYLVEAFKRQQPTEPELPPILIGYAPKITPPSVNTGYLPPEPVATPSPPKFDRSMIIKGFLTVPRAEYTEPYTVWYDAKSGASRVDYHEGGTQSYRTMMENNQVKHFTMSTDRTEEQDVVVCAETNPNPPALPNTDGFTFSSMRTEFGVQAEVWTSEISGRPGELGAARGEALFYRHHLTVHRRDDGFAGWVRMTTDRTEEQDEIVGAETNPNTATAADLEPPALPNTDGFTFAGMRSEFGVQAEVWTREVAGGPGEMGAARGEALLYRHQLTVHRRDDGFSVPLRYKVSIDSSVLGPDCDGYEHVYSEVREQEHNEDMFRPPDRQCDTRETLNSHNPEHMSRLDPLREFTMMVRDPRFDTVFDKYAKEFEREYADPKEEAVRKNLLIHNVRFCNSANRQSATFSVEVNFLSDRLDEELKTLLGVSFSAEFANNSITFPVSSTKLSEFSRKLPKKFDWRQEGCVGPVGYQGAACASCWAWAVTGSVEGALCRATKRLTELSVQALVDCSVSYNAHGCDAIGTWPVHAYRYIQDRGLPAKAEYARYDAKDHKCKAPPSEPTTHIAGATDVPPENIDALKLAIRRFAPNVVIISALKSRSIIVYKKGVLRDDRCKKGPLQKLDHAVLAVGWGEQRGETHFVLKNSWSDRWGEQGYIRVHAPSNTCGHLTNPSYASLTKKNVDKFPGGQGPGATPPGVQGRGLDDDDDDNFDSL